jgi:hypothetical protein
MDSRESSPVRLAVITVSGRRSVSSEWSELLQMVRENRTSGAMWPAAWLGRTAIFLKQAM